MTENRQILDNFILIVGKSDDNVKKFCVEMSKVDKYGYEPTEDNEGRFFFEIKENGKMVKFYQEEENNTEFLKELVFRPMENKNLELHVINDYE